MAQCVRADGGDCWGVGCRVVGLQMKEVPLGKLFTSSRNWLTLEGQSL